MKFLRFPFFIFLLIVSSSSAFAKWVETYENIDDRRTRLSMQDMQDACEEGVDGACQELLRFKLIPKDKEEEDLLTSPAFAGILEKLCTQPQGSRTCSYLVYEANNLRDSLKNQVSSTKTQLDEASGIVQQMGAKASADEKSNVKTLQSRLDKAQNQLSVVKGSVEKYAKPNCDALIHSAVASQYCDTLGIAMSDGIVAELAARCKSTPASCDDLAAKAPDGLRQSYVNAVCSDPNLLKTPLCAEILMRINQAHRQADQQSHIFSMIVWFFVLLGAVWVVASIFSTRCGSCKKFFALSKIKEEHLGTDFDGTTTRREETGAIKNRNNEVVQTIHTDQTYKNYTSHSRATYKCQFCKKVSSAIESRSFQEKQG